MMVLPNRKKRNKALNNLADIFENLYGERCSRHEPTCMTCCAWTIFDLVERMTDSSFLDIEDEENNEGP